MRKYKLKRLILLSLIPITFVLRIIAKASPELIEIHYSNGFYSIIAPAMNVITSVFDFSIAELIIYIFVIYIISFIIKTIIKFLSMKKEDILYELYITLVNILVVSSVIYFAFTFSFGLNYYRTPFVDSIELSVQKYSDEDLYELSVQLISDANYYRKKLNEDEKGVMKSDCELKETGEKARQCMNTVSHDYNILSGIYQNPKPIKSSKFLSKMGITGFFFPLTFEANVNVDVPAYGIPFTMMHELAHLRGFMQEEEANFIAYLSCMASGDDEFKYSASLEALFYTLNALYKADKDLYNLAIAELSIEVGKDKESKNEYWKTYDGKAREFAESANDMYLKANDQELGRKSYGELVDLLIAYNKDVYKEK